MPSATQNNVVNGVSHFEYKKRVVNTDNLLYPSRSLHFLEKLKGQSPSETNDQTQTPKLPLNVAIVGGGLGGLATAIALKRTGHKVTVYEAAPELGEVGAGIQVPPNSSRLLLKWGIAPYLSGKAVEPEAIRLRRWQYGEIIALTKLHPDFRASFDAPYYVIHRAHLLSAFLQLALHHGVAVETNSRVTDYNPFLPSLTINHTTLIHADLIIGADGIKSLARPCILSPAPDQPPHITPFAAYRATISTTLMAADPDTAWLLSKPGQNNWIGPNKHIMTYTIASGKSFNMVVSHPSTAHPSTWNQEDNVRDMKRQFEGWDPRILKCLDMVESTVRWPLVSGEKLQRWVHPEGKMVILGDAAHAMLPYMSQGAAMAVEDGAALATALSLAGSREEVAEVLGVWEKVRIERTSGMQQASEVQGKLWHFEDGPQQRARDESMRAEVEGRHFLESANQWSDPVTQAWCYAYDAEKEMEKAWEEHVGTKESALKDGHVG